MHEAQKYSLETGRDLGRTPWLTITREMITQFGIVTLDSEDPMHNDADWAREKGPFGGIVSYGFLTMSLLTYFAHQLTDFGELKYALNYGFDRLRVVSPVPVDSRIRAHFVVGDITSRSDGGRQTKLHVTIEIEGSDKPAIVAEWLSVNYPVQA